MHDGEGAVGGDGEGFDAGVRLEEMGDGLVEAAVEALEGGLRHPPQLQGALGRVHRPR